MFHLPDSCQAVSLANHPAFDATLSDERLWTVTVAVLTACLERNIPHHLKRLIGFTLCFVADAPYK